MKQARRVIRVVWVIAGTSFLIWLFSSYQARGLPEGTLETDTAVYVVETKETINFIPQPTVTTVGFIFYPGGMVDPDAYTPMARTIAEQEFATFIVKIPLGIAPSTTHEAEVTRRTQAIMQDNPTTEHWILGGHSRGGAIASRFAFHHSELLDGLVLIGTSHPKEATFALSDIQLPVLKIYGTHDGIASIDKIEATRHYLPTETTWVEITGGNHAQFGYYGSQFGDQAATITRNQQHALTIEAIMTLLHDID